MSSNENFSYSPEGAFAPVWVEASAVRRARFTVRTEYSAEFEFAGPAGGRPGATALRSNDDRADDARTDAVHAGMNERSLFFAFLA